MQCSYFDAHLCHSCTSMGTPYGQQLAAKDADARGVLSSYAGTRWFEPVASDEEGFRNRAKMVVGGRVDEPTLGIVDRAGAGIDLSDCRLYEPAISQMIPVLRALIQRAGLIPYSIARRKGELKNILATVSPAGESMIRFVVRSKKLIVPIRRELARLQAEIPGLRVVSVNLLREHVALLEGHEEIILTDEQTLPMNLGKLTLHLRPQSFFQTNTVVATALYGQGSDWVEELAPASLWDLYCGVGGFALHAATRLDETARVLGVEVSGQAVESARRTAAELSLKNAEFVTADATDFAVSSAAADMPELLVVNPPRRGLGTHLASWIESSGVKSVIYSSCNVRSLARDLESMRGFVLERARVLDMFPQTDHYEVITLLRRG